MMKQPTVRPARAAIAAVLVFASTPLVAQVAAPTAPPPIAPTQAAPAQVITAPAAPVAAQAAQAAQAPIMAAPSAVVQPTPVVAPVTVEAATEATIAPTPVAARATTTRTASARAQAVTPAAPTPAIAEQVPSTEATAAAPLESVSADPGVTATEEATVPVAGSVSNTAANGSDGLEWGLVGGAAALIGGLGFMAMRRRRPESAEMPVAERRTEPVTDSIAVKTTMDRQPAITAPDYVEPRAAYPAEFATGTHGSLETMAAEVPSAANPFLTRKNRLRRAHFMQRQQESVGTRQQETFAPAAAPAQEQRRASPVYDFGGGMTQRQRLRPATT